MTQEIINNKKQRLLDTAFSLFTDKGIKNTSIQNIQNVNTFDQKCRENGKS